MRVQTRDLVAAGESAGDIAARVLDALASGMVLFERKTRAAKGIGGRVLSRSWMIVRPVIEDGIVTRIVEDDETRALNAVGRHLYGIRPSDIDRSDLREVCDDVYWLGPVGARRVLERGRIRPVDLWSVLHPSSINHQPAYGDEPAGISGVGSDPALALEKISQGEREALAAMIEGLHLVDTAVDIVSDERRTERRTWRPMRPVPGNDGRPDHYEDDRRVRRYTVNADRFGFSGRTFRNIAPLLVEAGYDPRDGAFGHAYTIADEWVERVREEIGWEDEIGNDPIARPQNNEQGPAATDPDGGHERGEQQPDAKAVPDGVAKIPRDGGEREKRDLTERQKAIIAMLEGHSFTATGEDSSRSEVAEAIALHGGEATARLIAAAMERAATAAKPRRSRLWPRL